MRRSARLSLALVTLLQQCCFSTLQLPPGWLEGLGCLAAKEKTSILGSLPKLLPTHHECENGGPGDEEEGHGQGGKRLSQIQLHQQ